MSARPAKDAVQTALALIGAQAASWSGDTAQIRRNSDRRTLDINLLAQEFDRPPTKYAPEALAMRLADLLGFPAPPELYEQHVLHALPLLRPRVLSPDVLDGPARALCRRPLGRDYLIAISIGRRSARNFVTTRLLDAWGMSFNETLEAATDALAKRLEPEHLGPIEEAPGVLALRVPREPVAGAALALERLVPGLDAWPGTLLGLPTEETLVVVPLDEESDLEALASTIEANHAVAEDHPDPLSPWPYWLIDGALHEIRYRLDESDEHRRAHVETADPRLADLLHFLQGHPPASDPPDDQEG